MGGGNKNTLDSVSLKSLLVVAVLHEVKYWDVPLKLNTKCVHDASGRGVII